MSPRMHATKAAFYVKDSLMRILVASYLMAASVGIAPGPDLVPIFEQFMTRSAATVLGTAVLFLLAYAMMAGMWLRITILCLAIILVGSSYMENFIFAEAPDVGTMWQDVVVLCALMQSLIHLTNRQLRKTAIVRRSKPVRRLEARDPLVRLRPDDLPEQVQVTPLSPQSGLKPVMAQQRSAAASDDDIANIFA